MIALGLLFAPFTYKTVVFIVGSLVAFFAAGGHDLVTERYAYRTAAIRPNGSYSCCLHPAPWPCGRAAKRCCWRTSGMVLAEFTAEDRLFMRQLRTLTVGFHTVLFPPGRFAGGPAGAAAAPLVFLGCWRARWLRRSLALSVHCAVFRGRRDERWFTLLMSTGLTFGTISALYGFTHGIVSQAQYSFLVAAVIASAVIPTLVANFAFLPRHLLPAPEPAAGAGKTIHPPKGAEDAGDE